MAAERGGRFGLPRVRVETPAPPACGESTALGKEPVHRKYADFRFAPDSMCESGFLFSAKPMTLHDKFGRQITDLRISVTDRCNFRCVYCRSADPENYREHGEILSWNELERLAHIFSDLGIQKMRITGGEPLVREGVEVYLRKLTELHVPDISITTNGHLLSERVPALIA